MELNLDLLLGLASSALGMDILRALIAKWSKRHDEQQALQQAKETQREQEVIEDRRRLESQIREDYQAIREENRMMKAELREVEKKYLECEFRAVGMQAQIFDSEHRQKDLQEKLQELQLEYNELKDELEKMQELKGQCATLKAELEEHLRTNKKEHT